METALNGTGNALFSVSAPIICNILTSCEKLIPSFLLSSIRMAFTIDQIANFTNYSWWDLTSWIFNK